MPRPPPDRQRRRAASSRGPHDKLEIFSGNAITSVSIKQTFERLDLQSVSIRQPAKGPAIGAPIYDRIMVSLHAL